MMYGLYIMGVVFLGALLSVVVLLASKNGSKQAQLEALKTELKKQAEEQARAQKIKESVYRLPIRDARRRLHDVARQ